MPELSYMFVDAEMEAFVEFLCELRFEFIPATLQTPKPRAVRGKEAICRHVVKAEEPQWHLLRSDFSRYPLEIHAIEGGHYKGRYFAMSRTGGPTIDLSWSGVTDHEGKRFVGEGSVSHYPTFWNPTTEENERAPQAQRDAYREIVKWIKAHSVPSVNPVSKRTGKAWPSIRIGKEAAKAWAKGLHLGPPSNESRQPKFVPP